MHLQHTHTGSATWHRRQDEASIHLPRARRCRRVWSVNPHVKNPAGGVETSSKHAQSASETKPAHEKGFGHTMPAPHQPHPHASSGAGTRFLAWLQENGAPPQGVTLKSIEPPANPTEASNAPFMLAHGRHTAPHQRPIDMVVASRDIKAGEVALRVPEKLVISLERVFESEFVAELLTAGKLSELACLTLFLMYEKKLGEDSFWQPYIKELDRQRARGTQAVESPLLWESAELEDLLKGSPLLAAVKQRLVGIRKEYEELDTVWYMSQSLFSKYPFDLPTETFSFDLFKQAFSAVQACIVHLQGVAPARRFALVPLGPPLLSYSSISKALLSWDESSRSVQLVVDRDYAAGEPVAAWCGPQPNSRLLLNYGLVDENNPYDKLQITTILATSDPLFQAKRGALMAAGLATSQSWDLQHGKPLPPNLLPYVRLAAATTPDQVKQVAFGAGAQPLDAQSEARVLSVLVSHLVARIAAYKHTLAEDIAILANPKVTPRQRAAARLTKSEKSILQYALDQLGPDAAPAAPSDALPYLKMN